MTICNEDPIWAAVLAAEDAFGEAAEDHARAEAARASAAGDSHQAAIWDAAAQMLHNLHTINQTWARPRASLLPRIEPHLPGEADAVG
ncbi:hypothetical protein [Sphingopyxis kveilinensis]|uniref:hypothetical protein n=1 Tax=Sphingopyxis kveilinensis TaxID=3114367 RepID=UPI0030CD82F3